jgi:hypothetical protein
MDAFFLLWIWLHLHVHQLTLWVLSPFLPDQANDKIVLENSRSSLYKNSINRVV